MGGEGGIRQVELQLAVGVLEGDAPPVAAAACQAGMEAPQLAERHGGGGEVAAERALEAQVRVRVDAG